MIYNSKKYRLFVRFSFLISFIFSLILGILLSVIAYNLDYISAISIAIIVIISLIFFQYLFFSSITKYWRMREISKKEFPHEWENILEKYVAFYNGLNKNDQKKFKQKVLIFLAQKRITGVKTDIDDIVKVLIASSAVIPVFNYDDWEYEDISEILVYPGRFDKNYQIKDNKSILGLVTYRGGVVIISKYDILNGFTYSSEGRNVGIHEFAHKIDGEDGYIDGTPLLIMNKDLERNWIKIRHMEIEKIKRGESDIDPYAMSNNAEFFAVVSEYFFSNPKSLSKNHPELYNTLRKIFRIDSKSIITKVIKNMF